MTINTREEALELARKKKTNVPNACQKVTRDYYGAPSAGDQDKDGDADANDGWKSEPEKWQHPGDRKPPAGVPLYFKNKSGRGNGHRAISLPKFRVRSTDFNGATKKHDLGKMGSGTIEEVEKAMSLVYVGWSESITGILIPSEAVFLPENPEAPEADRIEKAVQLLTDELQDKNGRNKRLVAQAKRLLQIAIRK